MSVSFIFDEFCRFSLPHPYSVDLDCVNFVYISSILSNLSIFHVAHLSLSISVILGRFCSFSSVWVQSRPRQSRNVPWFVCVGAMRDDDMMPPPFTCIHCTTYFVAVTNLPPNGEFSTISSLLGYGCHSQYDSHDSGVSLDLLRFSFLPGFGGKCKKDSIERHDFFRVFASGFNRLAKER